MRSDAPETPAQSRYKVLVTEDEVLVRLTLADELRKGGLQVFEATDADEAISILKSVPLDVVTDLHMRTAMEGVDLAKYVRTHHPGVPLLLSSAHAPPFADCDCFDAFFVKPFDPQQIVTWIKRHQPPRIGQEDSDIA
jgi:two-component system, response regulator PdtaR